MSIFAALSKKAGIGMIVTLAIGAVTNVLGLTGDFNLQEFLLKHWKFALGVAVGLAAGGIMKNWVIGIIVGVAVIFILYTVVET